MSTEQTYRIPQPGDIVTRGTTTHYRVVEVETHIPEAGVAWRGVRLVSERSGRRFFARLADLYWPGTPGHRDTLVVPWEVAYPPKQHPTVHPDDSAPAPVGVPQPEPVRVVTAPSHYFPRGVIVQLAAGDGETVMLVDEDASEADVCAVVGSMLGDQLTGG